MDWLRRLIRQILEAIARLIRKILKALAAWLRRCVPKYDPDAWNDFDGVQFNNNCYNYACDQKTGTYAQPGRASGTCTRASTARRSARGRSRMA